jgi:hypothetical protein
MKAIAIVILALPAETSAAVLTCQNMVIPMEGGAEYRGMVRNEDYRFSVSIPSGKVGWGVRSPAPFHGFTVFLDGSSEYRKGDSCIDLGVGVRVVLPEDESEKAGAHVAGKPVTIGNRTGVEVINKEVLGNREFWVVTVYVDLPRSSGESDYVSVTFISPAAKYAVNRKTFNKFLSGITFW